MPESTDRFVSMDIREANAECGVKPKAQIRDNCPKCGKPVMLHCSNCRIQVTGCLCTEVDRFGTSEALEKEIERVGYEQAVKNLRRAGFVIPGTSDN